MPDGYEIAQRGRGGGMRGGFPGRGFPGRGFPGRGFPGRGFPGRGFPGRFPIRRFPRFFFFPPFYRIPPRCYYIDQFGRCCDYYGNCYNYDYYGGGYPQSSYSDESVEAWSASDSWDRMDDGIMDEDRYDQY